MIEAGKNDKPCDQNSVNVVGIHDNVGVSDQAVDVDEGVDERLSATLGVLADSRQSSSDCGTYLCI